MNEKLERRTTEVVPIGDEAAMWAARVKARLGEAVAAIVATGQELVAAKAALKHGEWGRLFADHPLHVVNPLPMSATKAQRFMAIARHPVLANPAHAPLLPPSWCTLYELTKVRPDVLEEALAAGDIDVDFERGQVDILVSRSDLQAGALSVALHVRAAQNGRSISGTEHDWEAAVASSRPPGIPPAGDPADPPTVWKARERYEREARRAVLSAPKRFEWVAKELERLEQMFDRAAGLGRGLPPTERGPLATMADRLLRALIRVVPAALDIAEECVGVGADHRPGQPVTTVEAAIQTLWRDLKRLCDSREQHQIAERLFRVQLAVEMQWKPLCAIEEEIRTLLIKREAFRRELGLAASACDVALEDKSESATQASPRLAGAIAALLEALEDLDAIPAVRVRMRQVTQCHGVTFADLLAHARWRAEWGYIPPARAWRKAAAPA
jgi:hypothetical protein